MTTLSYDWGKLASMVADLGSLMSKNLDSRITTLENVKPVDLSGNAVLDLSGNSVFADLANQVSALANALPPDTTAIGTINTRLDDLTTAINALSTQLANYQPPVEPQQ